MERFAVRSRIVAVLLALLLLMAGCASIGPRKVIQDRQNYNMSVTESWKRQILLNIVKIRYVEPISFMEVGDIVAGYTLETGGDFGFQRTAYDLVPLEAPVYSHYNIWKLGVSGRYTDRPTITYKPMTGAPFLKGVMSPMPLQNVALGLDSGISARFLVSLGVRSINRLRNARLAAHGKRDADTAFGRVVEILSQLQLDNALDVRRKTPPGETIPRLYIRFGGMQPTRETHSRIHELQTLLDLDTDRYEYELVEAADSGSRTEIVLQPYSLMQIMARVANQVDVPEADVLSHLAMPRMEHNSPGDVLAAVAVHSSRIEPANTFAAVKLHNHWFWVDNHDLSTKRVFSFLMLAFTLMEDGDGSPPLQLSVPVQ